jgi:hypothetical protein
MKAKLSCDFIVAGMYVLINGVPTWRKPVTHPKGTVLDVQSDRFEARGIHGIENGTRVSICSYESHPATEGSLGAVEVIVVPSLFLVAVEDPERWRRSE